MLKMKIRSKWAISSTNDVFSGEVRCSCTSLLLNRSAPLPFFEENLDVILVLYNWKFQVENMLKIQKN
ncbi:unnamed protein product [Prunus armeniaca]